MTGDDGKKRFVDVRVIIKGEDPTAHIGIRLIKKISTEFEYVNVLKLNNLIVKI